MGWSDNGIRSRLEAFLESGFKTLMKDFRETSPRLVHTEFSTDNLVYDPSQKRISGLLDFDFAHIGTVADDFFRSRGHGVGRFPDRRDGIETLQLSGTMLHKFPSPLPKSTEGVEWPQAKLWDDALRERNMYRPGNIPEMESLSSLFWLSSQLLPFKLSWDLIIENSDKDIVQSWKTSGKKLLDEFLKEQGY